jgi:hypothetical protein
MKKLEEKMSDGLLLAAILAQRRQPVASLIALDPPPLVDKLGYVPAHRQGQRNDLQVWYFFVVFFGI